ncbi:hypothetical protein [Sphingobacterium sp. LRF_L2]|uniref:hypothetical protein n=1 Tax=Sphingobacterium sp. LRF_L2 TaxID=3369421 RepID=UPI003F62264D
MIRPLEYCTTASHLQTSIETIEIRIRELQELREQYLTKEQQICGGAIQEAHTGELNNFTQK